jgi:hypothetical protein
MFFRSRYFFILSLAGCCCWAKGMGNNRDGIVHSKALAKRCIPDTLGGSFVTIHEGWRGRERQAREGRTKAWNFFCALCKQLAAFVDVILLEMHLNCQTKLCIRRL